MPGVVIAKLSCLQRSIVAFCKKWHSVHIKRLIFYIYSKQVPRARIAPEILSSTYTVYVWFLHRLFKTWVALRAWKPRVILFSWTNCTVIFIILVYSKWGGGGRLLNYVPNTDWMDTRTAVELWATRISSFCMTWIRRDNYYICTELMWTGNFTKIFYLFTQAQVL